MNFIDLNDQTLRKTVSSLLLSEPADQNTRIFMNGYQTWTSSVERTPDERQRGLLGMPNVIVRCFGIDRYGDYHFTEYPKQAGKFHGYSWCYFRRGDVFRLFASTDETNGYTVFRYDVAAGELNAEKEGGNPLSLFAAEGSENEVFDAWFASMGNPRRKAPPLAGYSSWYNRYENIDGASIAEDLCGCANVLKAGDLFQIDDGWQDKTGDWNTNTAKFPRGMKACVEDIHAQGFQAGLWLAPFAAAKSSVVFREHPEWLLRHEGKPWYCGCNWNGFYALDIDAPGLQEHLSEVFDRVLNVWGFDLVKLDFLYAAAPWPTVGGARDGETRGGRMCRAMKLLRQWCGGKKILGCGVPLWPAFGQVEYCRIGCDVGLDWQNTWIMRHTNQEVVSTKNAIGNSYFRRELNGRAFWNDPDVFFLRRDNIKLTEEQRLLLGRVNAQYGGVLLTSDNMGQYDSAQIEQYDELRRIWLDKSWTDTGFLKKLL